MVRLWPFGGNDTSAAGFEKVLSSLSEKINKASAKDTRLRAQQRRYRALWTLYTGFAYLVALLILVLVIGRTNWDVTEYTAMAGAPPAIYLGRLLVDTFYNYRLSGTQAYLDDLYKQRSQAIDKLKAATKYNSTQQLLDKYGGSAPKPAKTPSKDRKTSSQKPGQPAAVQRTGIAPPPTANIVSRSPVSLEHTKGPNEEIPHRQAQSLHSPQPSEEFAPNAFSYPPVPAPSQVPPSHAYDNGNAGPKWYDRIMDVILGEDETQPRNRIVLICGQCRLVNGQAPPGTRSLNELGRWKCMACGAMNGSATAAEKAVKEALASPASPASPVEREDSSLPTSPTRLVEAQDFEDDETTSGDGPEIGNEDDEGNRPSEEPATTSRSTRSQMKQRKK